jgi:predicted Zn-dependent protease
MYGDGLVEHQELDRAIPVLEAAVKAEGSVLTAHASLGRAYVQAGRYADALPYLEAAAAEDESGDLHLQLARTYQALQRGDDARKAIAEYQKRHQITAAPPTDAKEEALTPPE